MGLSSSLTHFDIKKKMNYCFNDDRDSKNTHTQSLEDWYSFLKKFFTCTLVLVLIHCVSHARARGENLFMVNDLEIVEYF